MRLEQSIPSPLLSSMGRKGYLPPMGEMRRKTLIPHPSLLHLLTWICLLPHMQERKQLRSWGRYPLLSYPRSPFSPRTTRPLPVLHLPRLPKMTPHHKNSISLLHLLLPPCLARVPLGTSPYVLVCRYISANSLQRDGSWRPLACCTCARVSLVEHDHWLAGWLGLVASR